MKMKDCEKCKRKRKCWKYLDSGIYISKCDEYEERRFHKLRLFLENYGIGILLLLIGLALIASCVVCAIFAWRFDLAEMQEQIDKFGYSTDLVCLDPVRQIASGWLIAGSVLSGLIGLSLAITGVIKLVE